MLSQTKKMWTHVARHGAIPHQVPSYQYQALFLATLKGKTLVTEHFFCGAGRQEALVENIPVLSLCVRFNVKALFEYSK